MKILFVGSEVNSDLTKIGGIENTIRELIGELLVDNEVTILIISNKRKKVPIELSSGKVVLNFEPKNLVRKQLLKNWDVINFIQTPFENPIFFLAFLFRKLFGKVKTVKLFFTYPSLSNYSLMQKIKLNLLMDYTIVFSKRLETLAKKITSNVYFFYPPVSAEFLTKKRRIKNNEKIKILYAGRLSEDKGLGIVIEVFKELPSDKYFRSIGGYFTTSSDKEKYFSLLKSLNLDELNIEPRSKSDNKKLPLSEYDILLLPYQNLSPTLDIPLLVLEGLASGCKVVTTELVVLDKPDNLFYVENKDEVKQFVELIEKISAVENTDIDLEKFSAKTVVKNYLKLLNKSS